MGMNRVQGPNKDHLLGKGHGTAFEALYILLALLMKLGILVIDRLKHFFAFQPLKRPKVVVSILDMQFDLVRTDFLEERVDPAMAFCRRALSRSHGGNRNEVPSAGAALSCERLAILLLVDIRLRRDAPSFALLAHHAVPDEGYRLSIHIPHDGVDEHRTYTKIAEFELELWVLHGLFLCVSVTQTGARI